jgi:hypothetical protein
MPNHRSARVLVIPLLGLAGLPLAALGAAGQDETSSQGFAYRAECSEETPRAAVLRIRWPQSRRARSIDVSVYKDGFRTARFVSAEAAEPEKVPKSGLGMVSAPGPLTEGKLPPALSLRLQSVRSIEDGAAREAVVGDLVPGLNYYVRVPGLSEETIRVRAPICPVDAVETPPDSPR